MPAVALTDRANLFGALEFSVTAKDAGVQPIVGCALPVAGIGERVARALGPGAHRRAAGPERGRLAATSAILSSAAYLDAGRRRRARRALGAWSPSTPRA